MLWRPREGGGREGQSVTGRRATSEGVRSCGSSTRCVNGGRRYPASACGVEVKCGVCEEMSVAGVWCKEGGRGGDARAAGG